MDDNAENGNTAEGNWANDNVAADNWGVGNWALGKVTVGAPFETISENTLAQDSSDFALEDEFIREPITCDCISATEADEVFM